MAFRPVSEAARSWSYDKYMDNALLLLAQLDNFKAVSF